jgi:hypothetical protein
MIRSINYFLFICFLYCQNGFSADVNEQAFQGKDDVDSIDNYFDDRNIEFKNLHDRLFKINDDIDKVAETIKLILQDAFYDQRAKVKKKGLDLQNPAKVSAAKIYGGKIGAEIFQREKIHVVLPILTEFLRYYKNKIKELSNDKGFLYGIFLALGEERHRIAILTNSENSYDFGKIVTNDNYLIDPINKWSFPVWNKKLRAEVIRTLMEEANFSRQMKNFEQQNYGNNYNYLIAYVGNELMPHYERCFSTRIDILIPQKLYEDIKLGKKHLDMMDEDIIIECYHLDRRQGLLYEENIFSRYGQAFMYAYFAEDALQLKKSLAIFIRNLSISSTYSRGQAAIIQWISSALCECHGYKLSYTQEWTAPEGIAEDMQALQSMNESEFVNLFIQNSILTPIK